MASLMHFKLGRNRYAIQLKWGFGLLCLFLFILFCLLGNWQIHRYQFKKTLLTNFQNNLNDAPSVFNPANVHQFQKVSVTGSYLNQLTILQNRIYQNKKGFEVFTPVQIKGEKKLLLVDRGWLEGESVPAANSHAPIQGYIKLVDRQFILGSNVLHRTFPLNVQRIDVAELKEITQQDFFPFILRLDPKAQNGFVRDWIISAVEPERHIGYAIQWFLMALALFIAYFCFCCEKQDEKHV